MRQIKDHALWIIPEEKVYLELSNLIDHLSKSCYAPHFEPHVTILGHILGSENEMSHKFFQLSSLVAPFKVRLSSVGYMDEYFRSLFIEAEKSQELVDLHIKAKKIFDVQDESPYMPHLSLLYGDFPSKIKEKIISEIGSKFHIEFEVKSIHLMSASIAVDPRYWYRVKEFSLG